MHEFSLYFFSELVMSTGPTLVERPNDSSLSPPPSKKVKWEVEDPSEYRPSIENMGKDQEGFRVFDDVS